MVQASDDGTNIAIQSSLQLGRTALVGTLKAPVSAGDELTPLTNYAGLLPGATASVKLTGAYWKNSDFPVWTSNNATTYGDLMEKWCDRNRAMIDRLTYRSSDSLIDCKNFSSSDLRPMTPELDHMMNYRGPPILYALELSAGPKHFPFFDSYGHSDSTTNMQWAASAGLGMVVSGHLFVSASVAYKAKYKAGDSVAICTPLVGTGLERCSNGFFGPPSRKAGLFAATDAHVSLGKGAAAIIKAEYDFRANGVTVEVPLYFVPNDKNALLGGLLTGWSSQEKRLAIGLFVGSAYGLSVISP
jgi:hypothetical protein